MEVRNEKGTIVDVEKEYGRNCYLKVRIIQFLLLIILTAFWYFSFKGLDTWANYGVERLCYNDPLITSLMWLGGAMVATIATVLLTFTSVVGEWNGYG